MNWQREGDCIVGILVREIKQAKTWQQANEASDAIFHVRLMQKRLIKETLGFENSFENKETLR